MKSRKSKLIIKNTIYVASIVLLITVTASFITYRINNAKLISVSAKYERMLNENNAKLSQYEQQSKVGWVLIRDIEAGEKITDLDVEQRTLPDYFVPGNVIANKEDIIGKVIKINALQSTAVTEEMVFEDGPLDPSTRKEEVQYVRLPLQIADGDTVDIRIVFPNGEDYIVVAKKKLDSVDFEGQNAFFKDTEEEANLLQAALVDAYINDAELYMKVYPEPELQAAPRTTYVPNSAVLDLMTMNPQIVNSAKWKLVESLRNSLEDRLEKINIEDKVRIGAGAPMGSAVAKRKREDGAMYGPSANNSAQSSSSMDGTSVGVNGIIDTPTTPAPPLNSTSNNVNSTPTPNVDSSQTNKVPVEDTTVYPVPNNDIPDVNVNNEEEVPDLLGGGS